MPRLFAVLTVCMGLLAGSDGVVQAQTIDPAFEQDILKFMELVSGARFGEQVGVLVSRQVVDAARKAKPDLPQRAVDIITEVVQGKFAREFAAPKGLRARLVPVYAKAFTHDEIRALLAFYATDLGRKALTALPVVAQESAQVTQQWAQELGPEIQSEIQRRFKDEGVGQ